MSGAAFDRATAVRSASVGSWETAVDPTWGAMGGPNGGYVAALVLRAMTAELAQPERAPRSLTLHFLRPPVGGPAVIHVVRERAGRTLSTLSARLVQGGKVTALALGAFGIDRPAPAEYGDRAPAVAGPGEIEPIARPRDFHSLLDHVDLRPAIGGPPLQGGAEALTGGWLRLKDRRPADALSLAMFCDAWWPAPWMRLREMNPAPTVDLTIHFRSVPTVDADDHVLIRVRSAMAHGGFFEEDAELWSQDGTLLAQSRQLALLRPR